MLEKKALETAELEPDKIQQVEGGGHSGILLGRASTSNSKFIQIPSSTAIRSSRIVTHTLRVWRERDFESE